MHPIFFQYGLTLWFCLVSVVLVLVIFLISAFFSSSTTVRDFEKLTTYECGFEPFSESQGTFDVKYYLIAILFLIFDLEIMFLLPWSLNFEISTTGSLFIIWYFLLILTVAFVYEWLKGGLDWQ